MAASIYVADSWRTQSPANPEEQSVWLDDTAIYWHLYRYFEAAKLDRRHALVDLYGGGEIDARAAGAAGWVGRHGEAARIASETVSLLSHDPPNE